MTANQMHKLHRQNLLLGALTPDKLTFALLVKLFLDTQEILSCTAGFKDTSGVSPIQPQHNAVFV
jgi:hypothetical protein